MYYKTDTLQITNLIYVFYSVFTTFQWKIQIFLLLIKCWENVTMKYYLYWSRQTLKMGFENFNNKTFFFKTRKLEKWQLGFQI